MTTTICRQVFDPPPVALFYTEYQDERQVCHSRAETRGTFPSDATAPAHYGPALQAYVCYLVTRQDIPIARAAELPRDTYRAPVSTGTNVPMVQESASKLDEFVAQVEEVLIASYVAHADTTGLHLEAYLKRVHPVSTTDLTLYYLDAERGRTAMETMGAIEHLHGVLAHDCRASYRTYANLIRALCDAHHLRELDVAGSTDGQSWANDMTALLTDTRLMVLEAKAAATSALGDDQLADIRTKNDSDRRRRPPNQPASRAGRQAETAQTQQTPQSVALPRQLRRRCTKVCRGLYCSIRQQPKQERSPDGEDRPRSFTRLPQRRGCLGIPRIAKLSVPFRSNLSTAAKQGANRPEVVRQLFNGVLWMSATPGTGP